MFTSGGEILVVGGTGMLRPAVHQLCAHGARVLVIARHPQRATPMDDLSGEFVPVAADWAQPEKLASATHGAMTGEKAQAAVLWIHSKFQESVTSALAGIIAPDAPVVRLWGSAGRDPRETLPPGGALAGHDVRNVVLGYQKSGSTSRWLSDAEISDGAIRALTNPEALQQVGHVDPWSQRP